MKILYVTRLFSGLENSFYVKNWRPSGVPTIYRVIEELDRFHTPHFIFTVKDDGEGCFSNWNKSKNQKFNITGLKNNIYIISGIGFFPKYFGRRLRVALREIRQFLSIIIEVIKFRPEVIYCDHANVLVGGILSRVQSRIPVIFRVMGVDGFMRQCLTPKSFIQKIYGWSYKSPFSLVICTQDGSGLELWTNTALSRFVRREILLNGVDYDINLSNVDERFLNLPSEKIIILFVGKLEKYKGCYEFVQSILLLKERCNNIHALVIGAGNEKYALKDIIDKEDANSLFTFIDDLPHSQIYVAHSKSDIYVSMNYFGNLSNANLEAIQSNDCMIIPEPQDDIDVVTNSFLNGAVVNVPIKNPIKLSNAIAKLIESEEKRNNMSSSVRKIKKNFIWSWKDRVTAEMKLLKNINNA